MLFWWKGLSECPCYSSNSDSLRDAAMSDQFDPYHKWLGIAPKDQPPHHYRLLGIDAFEDDRDVIDSAANRVMT